ncbi:MAG TPA: hypothetical protein VLT45_16665 [Kofleriaceae bacterium]|nr:hypothetical protein [Kofleriaceae bacterium]
MRRALLLLFVAGCASDVDPPWQLDHDRIIAVRATPPRIPAGATSTIDLFVGHKGAPTDVQAPDATTVVSPMSLADALSGTTVTAPSEDRLAAARAELGLMPGAPVPLQIGVAVASPQLAATKTVWLGDSADNPTLDGVTVGDVAPGASIIVPPLTDVHLFVNADDSVETVNWLTSCGSMHDFDLHKAYLRVEKDDPTTGELALVLRDGKGGVAWQVWPISAQ